jgi:TonB family protein
VKEDSRRWSGLAASVCSHVLLAAVLLSIAVKEIPQRTKHVVSPIQFQPAKPKAKPLLRLDNPRSKRPAFVPARPAIAGKAPQQVRPLDAPVQALKVPLANAVKFSIPPPSIPPPRTPAALLLPVSNDTPTPARHIEDSNFAQSQVSESRTLKREMQPGAFSASVGSGGSTKGVTQPSGFGSSGFGSVANSDAPAKGPARVIQAAGFSETAPSATSDRTAEKTKLELPEILSKPRPLYTAEAKAARIEGEVVIKVNLKSNGDVQILEVIKGLGHGLDEAASRAAEQIRFRPARRAGIAVDYTTTLRIVFQLA